MGYDTNLKPSNVRDVESQDYPKNLDSIKNNKVLGCNLK